MRRLLVVLCLLLAAAPAAASPTVVAHRGGALAEGVPVAPENSLPALERAAQHGWVLEFDVSLTKDGVPVVIHDDTLDRTSDCSGLVKEWTAADLRERCSLDVLGTGSTTAPNPDRTPIPTLAEVLAMAERHRAVVSPEIKNIPPTTPGEITGADDFDPDPRGFATTVATALAASGYPQDHMIVQSFWPPNLEVARQHLPGAQMSFLTIAATNDGAPEYAAPFRYEWVSPEFGSGLNPTYVQRAHAHGSQVTVFTPNREADITAAAHSSIDAIISDDPDRVERIVAAETPERQIPPPPTPSECEGVRARRSLPTVESYSPRGLGKSLRVFAMQFKQDLRHVTSYVAFRTKIECMIRERVLPRLAPDRPNVVMFNEDIGLMTMATGTRGAPVRELFADARPKPSCESEGVPCGTLAALGAVTAAYGPQVAAYRKRFPDDLQPVASAFVATTDTQVRGWMQVFSDMARRYGVYIGGSANLPRFRESTDPAEIALFADPDLGALPASVYVATAPEAYNTAFLWAPEDVRADGPAPLRNVVQRNDKVPLTPIELQIQITPGPSTGTAARWNLEPFAVPGTAARIGIATSLPAFRYGDPTAKPCADLSQTYMRCLDALGANVVFQDEANPGRWANDAGYWEPETWMLSTNRAVTDPTVNFAYNVTPFMVGNLADLVFDGQTAITRRAPLSGPGCRNVGTTEDRTEFLALLPWVAPDAPREELKAIGAKLAPGSGDALENDYAEGAIAADLDFTQGVRPGCAG